MATKKNKNQVTRKARSEYFEVPATGRFLIIDFVSRIVFYLLYQATLVSEGVFWTVQIFVIPILVYALATKYNNKTEEQTRKLNKLPKSTSIIVDSTNIDRLIFSMPVLGAVFAYNAMELDVWLRIILCVGILVVYFFYIVGLSLESPRLEKDQITKLKQELSSIQSGSPKATYIQKIDENDKTITMQEVEIKSLSSHVDTYTLESALFGGLAFSGFISIMVSDENIFTEIRSLLILISRFLQEAQQGALNWHELNIELFLPTTLIAAIATCTVICSLLFVSAIIARLRFYDLAKNAEFAVRLAAAYNTKEEGIFYLTFNSTDRKRESLVRRLKQLAEEIELTIDHSSKALRELRPMLSYIKVFRDAGVFVFVLLLVLSAGLISSVLAFIFISVSVLATSAGVIDKFLRKQRLIALPLYKAGRKSIGK